MHDFVGFASGSLADAHKDEVVEDAFGRQRDIHNLGEVHLKDGRKSFTDAPPM